MSLSSLFIFPPQGIITCFLDGGVNCHQPCGIGILVACLEVGLEVSVSGDLGGDFEAPGALLVVMGRVGHCVDQEVVEGPNREAEFLGCVGFVGPKGCLVFSGIEEGEGPVDAFINCGHELCS